MSDLTASDYLQLFLLAVAITFVFYNPQFFILVWWILVTLLACAYAAFILDETGVIYPIIDFLKKTFKPIYDKLRRW